MKTSDSYWLLLLNLPILLLIYLSVTWATCKPLSMIGAYENLIGPDGVPDGATCFVTNTVSYLELHSFPPIDENRVLFWAMVVAAAIMIVVVIPPTRRLVSRFGQIAKAPYLE